MNKNSLAVISLLFVAFGYTMLSVAARLLEQGFGPMTQVYVRVFIGFLLSMIIFRSKFRLKPLRSVPRKDIFWLLVMGIFGYSFSVYFITRAALETKLVNAGVIFSFLPFIVYAYSFLVLKEKFNLKLILLLCVSLFGVILITSKSFIPDISSLGRGELFAFISALCAGWWSVGRKKLSSHLNNAEITAIVMLIAALSGAAFAVFRGELLTLASFGLPAVLVGLLIGSVLNVVLTFLENFAFGIIDIVKGNQILLVESVFSLTVGYFFYQELISFIELLGAVLIISSVYIANRYLKV